MRRAWLLILLIAIACGTSMPIGPLEGTYAVVFDTSFASPSRSFSGGDLENAVKQLFTERGGAFRWFNETPDDTTPYDAVIVLRIAKFPGAGGAAGIQNRNTTGSLPDADNSPNMT